MDYEFRRVPCLGCGADVVIDYFPKTREYRRDSFSPRLPLMAIGQERCPACLAGEIA